MPLVKHRRIVELRRPKVVSSGGGAATTWNGSDIVNGALSGGNLTFAITPTDTFGGVRSVKALVSNQLAYWEHVYNVEGASGAGEAEIGVADATADLSLSGAGATLSPSHAAVFHWTGDNFVCADSANNGNFVLSVGPAVGDRIGQAFNSLLGLMWFRLNGGAWNDNLGGTQDPATAAGGLAIPFAGPYYALLSCTRINDQVTTKFSSASWVDAAPSGYSQISA